MKRWIILWVALLFAAPLYAEKKVKEKGDGWFEQHTWQGWYFVDTSAKLCFFEKKISPGTNGGVVSIPCANLAQRNEWKKIITWENK